jgi:processive 1,2-diacylglycerol beta-glucosyltransferase
LLDPLASLSPRRDRMARSTYYWAINRVPKLWSSFYAWLDRARPLPGKLTWLDKEMRWLEAFIARENPLAVCSTYPVFAFMLERLAQANRVRVPSYNVVTDSISINSMWWLAECDGWFLPNEDSAQVLREAGRPADLLHVLGFPVAAAFADPARRLAPEPIGPGVRPKVLFIITSGSKYAIETARLLLDVTDWEITFAVGRDAGLRRRITAAAAGRPAPCEVLGWTDRIPELLMTHHAVISKAGGATTQEAIAAHCPMIVNQVVPGQEEGNYELLRRHEIGGRADTPAQVVRILRDAFAGNGHGWRGWHARIAELARPTAATDIARFVLRRHASDVASGIPAREPHVSRHG